MELNDKIKEMHEKQGIKPAELWIDRKQSEAKEYLQKNGKSKKRPWKIATTGRKMSWRKSWIVWPGDNIGTTPVTVPITPKEVDRMPTMEEDVEEEDKGDKEFEKISEV